jgi:hypothetical protein
MRTIVHFIAVIAFSTLVFAQANNSVRASQDQAPTDLDVEGRSLFIHQTLQKTIGTQARLGWVMNDGRVVSDASAKNVWVLSTSPLVGKAESTSSIPPEQIPAFINRHHLAFDRSDSIEPLHIYNGRFSIKGSNPQVLVFDRPLLNTVAGYKTVKPPSPAMKAVWSRMHFNSKTNERRSFAIASRRATNYFFVFAALYENEGGAMVKEGIFLLDKLGRILGQEISPISEETMCDGCGVPTLEYRLEDDIRVMNVFSMPGFPYPLLMQDTSTIEGRAVSLLTFSKSGQPSEYRLYEYVF